MSGLEIVLDITVSVVLLWLCGESRKREYVSPVPVVEPQAPAEVAEVAIAPVPPAPITPAPVLDLSLEEIEAEEARFPVLSTRPIRATNGRKRVDDLLARIHAQQEVEAVWDAAALATAQVAVTALRR